MSQNQTHDQNDLDKWFAELEAQADQAEIARLAQQVLNRHQNREPTLEEKVLADFHGHAPIIESEFDGQLPNLTAKAKMYILNNLEPGQMFRFGVSGGGCSGFNYLFDVAEEVEDGDPNPPVDTLTTAISNLTSFIPFASISVLVVHNVGGR